MKKRTKPVFFCHIAKTDAYLIILSIFVSILSVASLTLCSAFDSDHIFLNWFLYPLKDPCIEYCHLPTLLPANPPPPTSRSRIPVSFQKIYEATKQNLL